MGVKESPRVGLHCGQKGAVFMCVMSGIYIALCLAYNIAMRVFFHAYYTSAYVAGLSVMVAFFVVCHHLSRLRSSLGCSLRAFSVWQTFVNFWITLSCLLMTAGYILLVVLGLQWNWDYVAAAILSLMNFIGMMYLFCLTCAASNKHRYSKYQLDNNNAFPSSKENSGVITYYQMQLYGAEGNGHPAAGSEMPDSSSRTSLVTNQSKGDTKKRGQCSRCCRSFCMVIFGVGYLAAMIVLILIFAISACHPAFVAADTFYHRNNDDLYTVQVDGHEPINLFFKCRGNGSTTIIFENGLAGSAYMAWHFIPRFLAVKYKVCIHDRRGYGWSEAIESDRVDTLLQQQRAKTNTDYFLKLIEAVNITTPFHYVGHSYGGHHLVYAALSNSSLIKSLIFIDSAEFQSVPYFSFQIIDNFKASGLLYILMKTKWIDVTQYFTSFIDFDSIPYDIQEMIFVGARSGYYLSSVTRESLPLIGSSRFAKKELESDLAKQNITLPVYLIDKDNQTTGWFPSQSFLSYQPQFHVSVPCATHSSLVYDKRHSQWTSELIDIFIRYDDKELPWNTAIEKQQNVLDRARDSCQLDKKS